VKIYLWKRSEGATFSINKIDLFATDPWSTDNAIIEQFDGRLEYLKITGYAVETSWTIFDFSG
jgi:hypothetical protein